jgi:hypothetical protein
MRQRASRLCSSKGQLRDASWPLSCRMTSPSALLISTGSATRRPQQKPTQPV